MNKQEILSLLETNLKSGVISQMEIESLFDRNLTTNYVKNPESALFEGKKSFSATNILYIIGGLILLIGIGTLLFRFWSDLSSLVRVVLTLGISIAAYISGILLRSDNQSSGVATVMQIIGGVLAPVGIFITIHEMGIQNISIGWTTSVAALLTVIYIVSLSLFRSLVFSFFSIAFGTWTLYSLTAYALMETAVIIPWDMYKYLTLAIGVAYLLLSSYVKQTSHRALAHTLDFFGSAGVFSAVLALSSYKPTQNVLWEIVGILCLGGGLYLSSVSHNRTILKTTGLFIFIFIGKFTGEYFVDSFGWPIALIISGLVLIGVGFGLVKFGNRLK